MNHIFKALLFGALALPLLGAAAAGAPPTPLRGRLNAEVLHVDDGDTIAVLVAGVRHKVRLSDIDAPEVVHCAESTLKNGGCSRQGQPFGQESQKHLARLVSSGQAELACSDYDSRYSRSVCRVYSGGVDVNADLVRAGLAWFNEKYSKDNGLRRLQAEALRARKGLWGSDQPPVAPWIWRDLCWKQGVCR